MCGILTAVALILGFSLSISFLIGYWSLLLCPVTFALGMRTVTQQRQIVCLQRELWNAHDALLEVVAHALERAEPLPSPAAARHVH